MSKLNNSWDSKISCLFISCDRTVILLLFFKIFLSVSVWYTNINILNIEFSPWFSLIEIVMEYGHAKKLKMDNKKKNGEKKNRAKKLLTVLWIWMEVRFIRIRHKREEKTTMAWLSLKLSLLAILWSLFGNTAESLQFTCFTPSYKGLELFGSKRKRTKTRHQCGTTKLSNAVP